MLYPELWLMVAEHLEIDKSSISKLVAVNKTTYDLLIPVLYATVTLFDEGSISLFHESMSLPSSSRRSNLVKDLWVVPGYTTPSRQIISIVPPVRFTLGTLKSLEKLTLTPTIVFESLFIDLKCSFRLTHLTCACYPDDHFAGFLQQQTSITNLDLRRIERAHWGGRATVGLANHYNRRLASQLPFLPHLTSITGDSVALKLLCAGRPISRVVITELLNTHGDALAVSIAQSTTPVCSIAIQVDTWREWQGTVLQLLRPLKSTHIASTVIDLRILFDARSAMTLQQGNVASDASSILDLTFALLGGFSSLERFELGHSLSPVGYVVHIPARIDGEVIHIRDAWISSCVTLKEIWLFGTQVM